MAQKKKQGIRRLVEIAGRKRGHLMFSGVTSIIATIFELAPFAIVFLIIQRIALRATDAGYALDAIHFLPEDQAYFTQLIWWGFGAVFGYLIFKNVSNMIAHVAAFDILYGIRRNLAIWLGKLPMGFFTTSTSGQIKKIVSEDVEIIETFIAHHIPDIVAGVAFPIITLVYLFWVDWRMGLATLAPLPFAVFPLFLVMSVMTKEIMKKYQDSQEAVNATVIEYVRGMPVVKVFNQTTESFIRFKQILTEYRDFIYAWDKKGSPPYAIFSTLVSSSLITILPIGIYLYLKGTLSLPVLLLFLILGSGYTTPLLKLANLGPTMVRINEGVRRIDAIIHEQPLPEPSTPKKLHGHSIEFRDVSFAYGEKSVLHHINFQVQEGTLTALVGPSGSGKTTMAHLLPRMWDITKGEILIKGISVKDLSIHDLMENVGFVFQDIFIYSDTVAENIRMGREGITKDDIIAAAKAAQCHDFIKDLPDGYETRIGEGGTVHLSGGEQQRLAIARVFLKDAPIILLDEATAYADAENESKIQKAFQKLIHPSEGKGKTVIVIAHRLSTIVHADQILVIDNGEIVERGRHEELVKLGGLYKSMWEAHTAARDWNFSIEGEEE